MTTTTDTYSASAWLGITAFYTPSNVTSSNTVVTSALQIEPGAYIANSSNTAAYTYSEQAFTTSQNTQDGPVKKTRPGTARRPIPRHRQPKQGPSTSTRAAYWPTGR